ncbi:MAG: DUF2804 domain-containing protein [Candidatus Izemoplasma sp.]
MQNEIKNIQPLLNEKGHLANPGFAKKMYWDYKRKDIKASKFKIKEWDYYLINNDDFGIAFTVADNSYLGFVSVTVLDFKNKSYETFSNIKLFTLGKFNMPESTLEGNVVFKDKKVSLEFIKDHDNRIISCEIEIFKDGKSLKCNIVLTNEPDESMVIATPFSKNKKAFYYNQKINCMRADGTVYLGEELIVFNDAYAVLDWGRGVWTYDNTWFWGTASGKINDKQFGFNIGYGFGDLSNATENMIFYDGKSHKFDQVEFIIPKKDKKYDLLKEWDIVSNDKRFNLTFTPFLDRIDKISLILIVSDQHQVFGKFNGYVVLDDGTKLQVKDLLGSAEVVHNRW